MPLVETETGKIERQEEEARLAALLALGILDTPPEPGYDAVTRLAAEYFQADSAGLGFADESRIWIKSHYGDLVRELPRNHSIFDMVLAEDGPVMMTDNYTQSILNGQAPRLRQFGMNFFASVPVRSFDDRILGALTIFWRDSRPSLSPDELRMLESLADMISSQLELRRLRRSFAGNGSRKSRAAAVSPSWPRGCDLRRALDERQFVLFYQPEVDSPPAGSSDLRLSSAGPILSGVSSRLWTSFH